MKRKLLAVALSLAMVLTLLPAAALAAEEAEVKSMTGQDFLALAGESGTITLQNDVILTSTVEIGNDLTIQLSGHTLTRETGDGKTPSVLMLDISGGSVTIEGEGTVTGGTYGSITCYQPKGVIKVTGEASLTVCGGATIEGGKIESNATIGNFHAIDLAGSGTLTIERSAVTGLTYGDRDAGNAVKVSGVATVVVRESTLIGGSSTSNVAGKALELRTSGAVPAQISNSTLTGGDNVRGRSGGDGLYVSSTASADVTDSTLTGGQGNSGGEGVNVSGSVTLTGCTVTGGAATNSTPGTGLYCARAAQTVSVTNCTVTGGSPASGATTNSAGYGIAMHGPVTLEVKDSTIKGGNNDRVAGDPIGGNALYFQNETCAEAQVTLIDTTLAVGNDPAGEAVIAGTHGAPSGSEGQPAGITVGGTLTIDGTEAKEGITATLQNTTLTPTDEGVTIVAEGGAAALVGENDLTVEHNATSEADGTTTYYPTATAAIESAPPGSTVVIEKVEEDETLPSVPPGVTLENQTDGEITVGGQTVPSGERLVGSSPSTGTTPPTGSSPSSGTTSTTVTNSDGSITTTVTDKKTGTVTATTKYPDGSTLVVETKKDGTVTTTATRSDGLVVKTMDAPGEAVTASVTAPEEVGVTTVVIPADDVTPGTVAVDAKTGEVLKLSVPTEEGLRVKLECPADLVLEDRSGDFIDTPGHWARDGIDFTVAHGLFSGTTSLTFSPDEPMTRAMMMTMLARFGGCDTEGGETWHEKGMAWAIASGVSDGTAPEATISREQFVTMLYRYAGSPAVEGELSAFPDVGTVSGYAADAMSWAVGTGIITGTGAGTLAPQAGATRAQVATMLMRFCVYLVG